MAGTPKDTSEDTPTPAPIPPEASRQSASVLDRLNAVASLYWEAGETEISRVWKFIIACVSLTAVIGPMLALTGFAAHVGFVEKFGLAAGSMEFSTSQIFFWGWLAYVVQLRIVFWAIGFLTLILILLPVVMKVGAESFWLQRLTRVPIVFIALLVAVVFPASVGFSAGKTLARDMVMKADYSVRFVIPPALEPSFDPAFLTCNRTKGDLRKVWASKEEVVVYSISQKKTFEVFMKDIQNAVAEPIENVKQTHKL